MQTRIFHAQTEVLALILGHLLIFLMQHLGEILVASLKVCHTRAEVVSLPELRRVLLFENLIVDCVFWGWVAVEKTVLTFGEEEAHAIFVIGSSLVFAALNSRSRQLGSNCFSLLTGGLLPGCTATLLRRFCLF